MKVRVHCDSEIDVFLIVEILQIVRSEHTTVEIDPGAETSEKQIADSLPVPVPPKRKRKMKNTEEGDEMLEKAFTILTSAAAAATADDDECRSFGSFISNKLRNYLPCTRNKVQHEICNIIFAADQHHFDVSYQSPPSPPIPGFLSHHSFLYCWFRRRKSQCI